MTDFPSRRERMIERQIAARGVRDPRILDALRAVPREEFVAPHLADLAYDDHPLPIAEGQTISQPFIVALMVEALEPRPTDRALEVGAGSGYAAAVLSRLVAEVFAIERHESLAVAAAERLARLGFGNVRVTAGDGSLGWPEHAPYDGIMVAAGGPEVPRALLDQLAPGGRLVLPVGPVEHQVLLRVRRAPDGSFQRESLGEVRFVPLVGEEGWPEERR